MLPLYCRNHIEKLYCAKGIETCKNQSSEPAIQINESITKFECSRNVEICLCGDGKTETEVHFLNPDFENGWDPCLDQSFSRKKKTDNLGAFNLNLYVYEGPGYGFGDQPLREANVFFLQYDRGQQASLEKALEFAQRILRVREDFDSKPLFVLASNGFDYTKSEDNCWALSPHEADIRNSLLNLLDYDTFLVSLLLSFSNVFFIQSEALHDFEAVSREEGRKAATGIGATYIELNAYTGRGVSEAFITCMNMYINEAAEKHAQRKDLKNSATALAKSMLKSCVKFAKKNLEKRLSVF